MKRQIIAVLVSALPLLSFAEAPYAFKSRLLAVHRPNVRDLSQEPAADEYVLSNGVQIVVADDASALVRGAAEDFRDYLLVSMCINASVCAKSEKTRPGLFRGLEVTTSRQDAKPGFGISVTADGIAVDATDSRMAAQALYHLEDRMNFRKAPFLRHGKSMRHPMFSARSTFSGFGNDLFPDAHLNQIAHRGFTSLSVWLRDYDVIYRGVRQDVNDLMRRAEAFGLRIGLSAQRPAFVHPDDPKARAAYDEAYGSMVRYYPRISSIGFSGEISEFPSKDPRASGRSYRDKSPRAPGDDRPDPGWFPCSDWADWVRVVKDVIRSVNPKCGFGFSTYNWGNRDEKARCDLIASLPKDIVLSVTFEMYESHVKRNGLVSPVADYSLAFPGPGRYFISEAAAAKAAGIPVSANSNTGGLTWDFGNIPYQPAPWQWKKKWDAIKEAHAKWNLVSIRENHEYGWYPSFISELEKDYLVEEPVDFDSLVRAIAVRDYGEANADKAMEAWRLWSHAANDYVPTDENQYGPCRLGPAYPFNFYGPDLHRKPLQPPDDFPLTPGFVFRGICHFDFAKPVAGLGQKPMVLETEDDPREIELFESQVADYRAGARLFREIAATLPEPGRTEANRMAALGEYLMHACRTVVNLKRARRAYRAGDRKTVLAFAREEYANATEALKVVDEDSRLGWLASCDYTGSRPQIEWKLRKMRELYGRDLER